MLYIHSYTMLCACLLLAVTPIRSQSSSSLRHRRTTRRLESFVHCQILQLESISKPNGKKIDPQWACVAETEGVSFIIDDIKKLRERFGEEVFLRSTKLKVPWVSGIISSNDSSISIVKEKDQKRRRHLATKLGTHKLLIVRVIGNDTSPSLWKADLNKYYFGDNANVSSIYAACSKNKLKIVPATGPNNSLVTNGVINIRANENLTDMPDFDVLNIYWSILNSIEGLDYATVMFVMPKKVDFGNAAGKAFLSGNVAWVEDWYAPVAKLQVHEYGHLLGLAHSGDGDSEYGDNNGIMGGQDLPWIVSGPNVCFNAAKLWNTFWFTWRHKQLNPRSEAFSNMLVSHDDVVNSRGNGEKMIVKVVGDKNIFYVMYNRRKGINRDAIANIDQVVITQQNSENGHSNHIAGLSDGASWTYGNFANTGKSLVIKNCFTMERNNVDTAKVLIYLEGLNNRFC